MTGPAPAPVPDDVLATLAEIGYGWRHGDGDHNLSTLAEYVEALVEEVRDARRERVESASPVVEVRSSPDAYNLEWYRWGKEEAPADTAGPVGVEEAWPHNRSAEPWPGVPWDDLNYYQQNDVMSWHQQRDPERRVIVGEPPARKLRASPPAVLAGSSVTVPDGWVLAPLTPTKKMIEAAVSARDEALSRDLNDQLSSVSYAVEAALVAALPAVPPRTSDAAIDTLKHPDLHPLPWSGREEGVPIADTGDEDVPFVIRDAEGEVVQSLYERWDERDRSVHIVVGERVVAGVNALSNPNYPASYGAQSRARRRLLPPARFVLAEVEPLDPAPPPPRDPKPEGEG